MKKNTNNVNQFTPEQIAKMLATLTPEQLATAAKERQQASLQPLIDEYIKTDATISELEMKIQAINPEWNPPKSPSVSEKILLWVTEQKKPVTKAEISAGIGKKFVTSAIKKLVTKGSLTVKDDKYSVSETKK
jgi:hypothetical protein